VARPIVRIAAPALAALLAAGCSSRDPEAMAAAAEPELPAVVTTAVVEEPVTRFIRVSGTLAAR
jgi:type IV pilus biogenesis protein CpaD/CtpE